MLKLLFVALALNGAAPAFAKQPMTDHRRITILQHQVRVLAKKLEQTRGAHTVHLSKHAWPDLTDAEKSALADVLKGLPKTTKFDIICNDAGCADLAMDIDDAMEAAGLESALDRSLGPLGYGIVVQVNPWDRPAAETAIAALKKATAGRLDVPLMESPKGTTPPGYVSIVIGKYRKK